MADAQTGKPFGAPVAVDQNKVGKVEEVGGEEQQEKVTGEPDGNERDLVQPAVPAVWEEPDIRDEATTQNIAVDIPKSLEDAAMNGYTAEALEDIPLSADTDQAVENMVRIESLGGSPEHTSSVTPALASATEKDTGFNDAMKDDVHDNDLVHNRGSVDNEGSDETIACATVKDEMTNVHNPTTGRATCNGPALTRDRQDSLASLSSETDSCWDSSEGTLRSGTLPEEAEENPLPVQNVQKKDVIVEAVDVGVSPQQAQFVVLESVTEEDDVTANGPQAGSNNGDALSAKVRARDNVADDKAAPAAPLNGEQVIIDPHVPTAVNPEAAVVASRTDLTATTKAPTTTTIPVMTQTKTKLQQQSKRDVKPLVLTLRIAVALPLVVVVMYCTYSFSHLPIINRSSP